MKKKLFAIAALLMTFGHVLAQTSLTAENVTVPQNGQAYLVINYQFDSSVTYAGYSIDISLPEGLSLAKNTAGKYDYEKGDATLKLILLPLDTIKTERIMWLRVFHLMAT